MRPTLGPMTADALDVHERLRGGRRRLTEPVSLLCLPRKPANIKKATRGERDTISGLTEGQCAKWTLRVSGGTDVLEMI